MTSEASREKSSALRQITVILIVCISSITSGAQYGWTSPFVVKITQDTTTYDISEDEASNFVTLHIIAYGFFGLFAPKLSDWIGRKRCMYLLVAPQAAFWAITAITRSAYGFYIARIVSGLADGIHYSVIPVYIGEIAEPGIRGAWGNVVPFNILGQLYINVIAQWFNVRDTAYISLSLCLVYLILLGFTPESPYWYLMGNKDEDAKRSLRFLRNKRNVDKEFMQLKCDVDRQMSETGRWSDLVRIDSNRTAMVAAMFLRFSQLFSGVYVLQSYTQFVFEKSGSKIDAGLSTIIIATLNFFVTVLAGFVGERLGRKISYLTSIISCSIVLLLESTYFYIDQNTSIDVGFMTWFPLVGIIFFVIFSSIGLTTVPTLMMAELFSNSIKANGTSFMIGFTGALQAVSHWLFYVMNSHFGLYFPFALFGAFSFCMAPLILKVVPETRGRTLEQIQQELKKKKKGGVEEG